ACPVGFHENAHHKSCLKILTTSTSWHAARAQCADLDSALVTVDSLDMVHFMTTLMTANAPSVGSFWTPVNDLWEEGDYRSTDGTAVTYFHWYTCCSSKAQPNDANNEQNCVLQDVITLSGASPDNGWQDKACAHSTYPVCELWPEKNVRSKTFTGISGTSEYNLDVIAAMTSVSRLRCAVTCGQNLLCDAFAVLMSQPTSGPCKLLTLRQQNPAEPLDWETRNQMAGFKLYLSRQ
ncbi:hypothetical protein BaRGS_00008697, partial [Batillaria attramentaria]